MGEGFVIVILTKYWKRFPKQCWWDKSHTAEHTNHGEIWHDDNTRQLC